MHECKLCLRRGVNAGNACDLAEGTFKNLEQEVIETNDDINTYFLLTKSNPLKFPPTPNPKFGPTPNPQPFSPILPKRHGGPTRAGGYPNPIPKPSPGWVLGPTRVDHSKHGQLKLEGPDRASHLGLPWLVRLGLVKDRVDLHT